MDRESKSDNIKNRESWLKVIVIILFAVLIAWKILTSPMTITIADFRLSDLLSIIMAIFAIGLSVAFYLKATDTSNTFYDNTYKFTKEVSEILGRIEAGFGERLRHLDEGYTGLRDKFDKMPIDPVRAEKQVKKEEEELRKREEEKHKLFDELAERARLEAAEKEALFTELKKQEEQLQESRNQLAFLQKRLERAGVHPPLHPRRAIPEEWLPDYLARFLSGTLLPDLGGDEILQVPERAWIQRFDSIKDDLAQDFIRDLSRFGIVDKDKRLTKRGIQILRKLAAEKLR